MLKYDRVKCKYCGNMIMPGTYCMAEYLKEICPECEIEVTLEGNNSELKISVDDNEYEKIVEVINKFLEENKL